MFWRSFRGRLIATNIAMLAIALIGTAWSMMVLTERQAMANIDRELLTRIRRPRPIQARLGPGDAPNVQGGPRMGGNRGGPGGPNDRGLRFYGLDRKGQAPIDAVYPPAVRAAWNGREDVRTVRIEGMWIRVVTLPIMVDGQVDLVGQSSRDIADVELIRSRQREAIIFIVPLALMAAGIGGFFLANRALRPIDRMADASRSISAENLQNRLPIEGDDEMARLARSFNSLLERLESSFQKEKAAYRKLETAYESQKQFAADASHELRTPLSRIKLIASASLSQDVSGDEKKDALVRIDRSADEMSNLINDLLALARADADQYAIVARPTEVADLAGEVIESLRTGDSPEIKLSAEPGIVAEVDPLAFRRILANLLANAIRHTPRAGKVTIELTACEDGLELKVSDTGEGIAAEHLPRVADRFYRVDSDRNRASGGTGLGLAMVKALVEAHRGELSIQSRQGIGTTVVCRFPSS